MCRLDRLDLDLAFLVVVSGVCRRSRASLHADDSDGGPRKDTVAAAGIAPSTMVACNNFMAISSFAFPLPLDPLPVLLR